MNPPANILVTGSSRGLGRGIAVKLAAAGHSVAIHYANNRAAADETAAACEQVAPNSAQKFPIVGGNVALASDRERLMDETLAAFGRLDALVNNAGVAVFKPIGETTFEEFRYVLGTNLDGAFLCSQACIEVMKKNRHGSIVNIASISGLRASTLRVAYGTSKAAIIHLTKQQAVELGTIGIRANVVAPGPVDTEMSKLVHSVAIRSDYYDTIPMNRYGTPEEIANAVGFLCSPEAAFINGQCLAVDGGFDASGVGIPTLRKHQEGSI